MDEPDVSKWNLFWMRHCNLRGQWKFPEDMDINLPMGLGTSIYGRNWTGVNFARASIPDKNFSNHILQNASFYHADLRRCAFVGAHLQGADLRGANLAVADLTQADLSGADLRGARLKGAILTGAKFKSADLRFAQDIEFDENPIEGAHFTSRVGLAWKFAPPLTATLPEDFFDWAEPFGHLEDRWSKLRRTYTGPRYLLLLLLMIAFLLPHILQVATLVGLGQAEAYLIDTASRQPTSVSTSMSAEPSSAALAQIVKQVEAPAQEALVALESRWHDLLTARRAALWNEMSRDLTRARQEAALALHAKLEAEKEDIRRQASGVFAAADAAFWQRVRREYDSRPRYRVWQLVLGLNRGAYAPAILAVILIVFNVLRTSVTVMVSSMREAEERSGVTPAKVEYAFVYRLHRLVSVLWLISITDLAYHFWLWLKTPVVLF